MANGLKILSSQNARCPRTQNPLAKTSSLAFFSFFAVFTLKCSPVTSWSKGSSSTSLQISLSRFWHFPIRYLDPTMPHASPVLRLYRSFLPYSFFDSPVLYIAQCQYYFVLMFFFSRFPFSIRFPGVCVFLTFARNLVYDLGINASEGCFCK